MSQQSTENTDRQSTLQALLENAMMAPPCPPDPGKKPDNGEKKLEDLDEMDLNAMASSAFLGPNLWDNVEDFKDFKLEAIDLDAFFAEAGILVPQDVPVGNPDTANLPQTPDSQPVASTSFSPSSTPPLDLSTATTSTTDVLSPCVSPPHVSMEEVIPDVDYSVSPTDVALASIPGKEEFNPRKRAFSDEELRPQPMIKKSRKIFVPEDLKDDKYWERRKKNNVAAKRSRDARRIKENQVALRAAFLEKENATLKEELLKAKEETLMLSKKLMKYEQQDGV